MNILTVTDRTLLLFLFLETHALIVITLDKSAQNVLDKNAQNVNVNEYKHTNIFL